MRLRQNRRRGHLPTAVGWTLKKFLAWLYIVKLESRVLLRKMPIFWVKMKKWGLG